MAHLQNILIAVALAMDAFAVSVSIGTVLKKVTYKEDIFLSIYFGFFQFIMPIIGWNTIKFINLPIYGISTWISSGLLFILGAKMIYESFSPDNKKKTYLSHKIYLALAISTSLDALLIGISFSLINKTIIETAILAGIITSTLTFIGFHLGKKIHNYIESKSEVIGGLILISIGIKILLEQYKDSIF